MKKIVLLLFVLAHNLLVSAQSVNLEEARKLYMKSGNNKEACKKLYDLLAKIDEKNQNLLLGYKGAVMAEMAKHSKDASQKLKFFKEGRKKLDQAILNDIENIELRFLRLSIQLHTPDVLHYNGDIANDEKFIQENLDKIKNQELKKSIAEFMAKLDKKNPESNPK